MRLENKVAIITGGGRGIGRAFALRFAQEGASVVLAQRTTDEIECTASEIRDSGGQALAVTADLQNPEQSPQKLPFFGAYRWRNNQRLIYVSLDPEANSHEFYEYNILTKKIQPLFPGGTNLTIANNDWQVSPDGHKITFVAAKGMALDGIWVLDIDQN